MGKPVEIGQAVTRMINGEHLSREETSTLMADILLNKPGPMEQGAFLAAISANGPTPQEIAGTWQAIYTLDTLRVTPKVPSPLVDNCGTGMDGFKTFNISTAAALVAAAGGVYIARHGARAITSRCGTVDICEALGVDVDADATTVKTSIETCGIGLFNGMSPAVHPRALFRILSQIHFGSILNISASLANPAAPKRGVRGVYAAEMIRPVAETMRAIGFERAIVFHGTTGKTGPGMDELSPVAANIVAELLPDGTIIESILTPASVGIPEGLNLSEIAGGDDPRREASRLIRLLAGKETGALREAVCLNAAPIFQVAGRTNSIKEGVILARELIASGATLKKLEQWIACQQHDPMAGDCRQVC